MPPPSAAQEFVEVTRAAGIRAVQRLPTPDLATIVDAVGAGATFADFDDDGRLDLVVTSGPRSPAAHDRDERTQRLWLYRNTGDGRFEEVTQRSGIPPGASAVAVAAGDVDGDGDRDLYLVDRGPNRLWLNRGDGRFEDATDRAGVGDAHFGVGAVFFDMEGDGDLDLYVANYLEHDPAETAFFAPDGYPGPLAYKAEGDVLYRNRGDGTFEDVTGPAGIDRHRARGMSVAAADFDEDGDTDVFVANDATENFLWRNRGDGTFEEVGAVAGVAMGENGEQTSAMAADVGDVDGDGHLDLTVSDTAFGAFYRQVAPGIYQDQVMRSGIGRLCGQYVSWGQTLLDYDNDGDLDLFVVNSDLHHLVGWEDLLLANDGSGQFTEVSDRLGAYGAERPVGRGAIAGDYDNDGDLDLFVTTLGGAHHLLRNDAATGSWIALDLVGLRSRDAVGARVEIEAGGRRWVAEARMRNAYLGQGDPRVHVGLGPGVDVVDSVRVRWADGTDTVLTALPAGRIHRVEQGRR